ncbi:hypothetical protein ACCO45_001937 [Purpureocillium lilacinum]|uniref:Uncharacterized protein n=1 Tax=Purpureocillium lilacinum TaxID=33203 RepID=A0ACC4E9B9_PURLI
MAVGLARQVYSALVLDSGEYRNARAVHMHTVPGFDHASPASFRDKIRRDLLERDGKDASSGGEWLFEATDEQGNVYTGRKLGLGTGVRDVFPRDIPGYDECWGRGIFHCMFCHGFEERGAESAGVLAAGMMTSADMLAHIAPMVKRLARSVTVGKIRFDTRRIARVALAHPPKLHHHHHHHQDEEEDSSSSDDAASTAVTLHFDDGTSATEGFVANHPAVQQRAGNLVAELGLQVGAAGSVVKALEMGTFAAAGLVAAMNAELDARDEL